MISSELEYIQYKDIYLALQKEQGSPDYAILVPSTEKIYEIDLNTRTISSPEFLSVSKDHRSETIYFKLPRFYDNVDLSKMTCIIQYINAKKDRRIFAVPFVDIDTYKGSSEMVFPWIIDAGVATTPGIVSYSIKFYKINDDGTHYDYELNTLPATSKILTGLNINPDNVDIDGAPNEDYLASRADKILEILQQGAEKFEIQWLDL